MATAEQRPGIFTRAIATKHRIEKHLAREDVAFWGHSRTPLGELIVSPIINRREKRIYKREKEEKIVSEYGDVVWIWPGKYLPDKKEDEDKNSFSVSIVDLVSKELGLKQGSSPRHIFEPSREIPENVTPAEHYLREADRLIRESVYPEHISGIVVTDVKFRDNKGEVDEAFLHAMSLFARARKIDFCYIPSPKLFGSDNPEFKEEIRDSKDPSSYWINKIIEDLV